MLKVAFIHYIPFGDAYKFSFPPLGIGWIASALRRYANNVDIAFFRDIRGAIDWKADLIGFSADTGCMGAALQGARILREQTDAVLVLGGSHVTALPHKLHEDFDFGVVGEGEHIFLELVQLLQTCGCSHSKLPSSSELMKIHGLIWHENGVVRMSPSRPLVENLDELPFPDRDLLGGYAVPSWQCVHMVTARGCPYKCHFCASAARYKGVRQNSAERVVEEIALLREQYDPSVVYMVDDLLVADRKRLRKICDMLHERGLDQDVLFRVHGRANVIDEELIDLLVRHNFTMLDFGIESNSAPILKYLNKTGVTPEVNQRAMDLCAQGNISVGASLIIGSPQETHDDVEQTFDFARRNSHVIHRLSCGTLVPLPGTPLWKESLERGIVSEDMDWSVYMAYAPVGKEREVFESYPIAAATLSRDELFEWYLRFCELGSVLNSKGEACLWEKIANFQHSRLAEAHKQLDSLKGSRVVKAAMALRDLAGKAPKHGE